MQLEELPAGFLRLAWPSCQLLQLAKFLSSHIFEVRRGQAHYKLFHTLRMMQN